MQLVGYLSLLLHALEIYTFIIRCFSSVCKLCLRSIPGLTIIIRMILNYFLFVYILDVFRIFLWGN